MQVFVDNGTPPREWQISLTYASLKRVKDLLGVDLADPMAGSPPLVTRIDTDLCLLCDVLYAAVKPQADAAGVTSDRFGELLGPDAIHSAHDALFREWIDFFQRLQRPEIVRALEMQVEYVQKAIKRAVAELNSGKLEKLLDQRLAAVSIDSPNWPDVLGATPGPGPSGS